MQTIINPLVVSVGPTNEATITPVPMTHHGGGIKKAIAVVATSSALLAKPLADLLLKVFKPVIKKVITKISKIRGKKVKIESLRERRDLQRERSQAIRTLRRMKDGK